MVNNIENMIDMRDESETPDTHHFFDTSEDATKLSHTDAEIFIILWHSYFTYQRKNTQTYS